MYLLSERVPSEGPTSCSTIACSVSHTTVTQDLKSYFAQRSHVSCQPWKEIQKTRAASPIHSTYKFQLHIPYFATLVFPSVLFVGNIFK